MIEPLEQRTLLATIHVGAFGAVPNDGINDTTAITNAINSSSAGDTIRFGGGTYDISSLNLPGSRTYSGDRGATLASASGKLDVQGNGVTVQGLKLRGLYVDLDPGFADVTIRRNDFANPPPGTFNNNGPAIFAVGTTRLNIAENHFHDYDKYGIYSFSAADLSIVGNRFTNIHQGAHIINSRGNGRIEGNVLTGLRRMGFEAQQQPYNANLVVNWTIRNNHIHSWRSRDGQHNSFGLSIMDAGKGTISGNVLQANASATGSAPFGYGIEVMFDGAHGSSVVENNVVGGPFKIFVANCGRQTTIRNNRFFGSPLESVIANNPGQWGSGQHTASGNTHNSNLSAMPGRFSADSDLDGGVGMGDFSAILSGWGGHNTTHWSGDFNGDGVTDLRDYNILASQYGRTA